FPSMLMAQPPMPPMHPPIHVAAPLPEPLPVQTIVPFPGGVCPGPVCAGPCPAGVCPAMPFQPGLTPAGKCLMAQAALKKSKTSHIHLIHEGDKSRLKVESDGFSATCVRISVAAGEGSTVTVAAGKKRVHVSGKQWKAHADKVEMAEDGKVVLVGHVKI